EALDRDLAAVEQQVTHRIEHGVEHARRGAPRHVQLLGDAVGEDALVRLPAEDLLGRRPGPRRRVARMSVHRHCLRTPILHGDVLRVFVGQTGHPAPLVGVPADPGLSVTLRAWAPWARSPAAGSAPTRPRCASGTWSRPSRGTLRRTVIASPRLLPRSDLPAAARAS